MESMYQENMSLQEAGSSEASEDQKSGKLAGNNRRREEQLVALDSEREDSGIDSDEELERQSADESGGTDDLVERMVLEKLIREEQAGRLQEDMDGANSDESEIINLRHKVAIYGNSLEPDRNSPPLYEVELTASDEDDDASVLELVIPVHPSRYQRVPTSSPKRGLPVAPALFCSMFCCLRNK